MRAGPRIVVVGSSNTDMVIAGRALPRPGESLTGGEFYTAAGGKGANQAVAAARLLSDEAKSGGFSCVTFVAAVGDDHFGRHALGAIVKEGVDCGHVRVVSGRPSGVALIMVDAKGENLIAVAPGANAELGGSDVRAARDSISKADVVLAQLETSTEAVSAAFEEAARAGARTLLNPAPAPGAPLPGSMLASTSILTPNETEFEALAGVALSGPRGEEAARRLARTVREALVVTRGAGGVRVLTREGDEFEAKAFAVEAVDTVAAGDAFNGALAVALAERASLRDAVRFASAAAAISVTRRGAQPSLPTRAELAEFLRGR
jgi:ribokinase